MQLLPKWEMTSRHPAFFDAESGSCIEMTARVYNAMQTLIKEYNAFVEEINTKITDFDGDTKAEIEQFKVCITELVHDFIHCVESKIDKQDTVIADAVDYMKENLDTSVAAVVNEMSDNGQIQVSLDYNEQEEELLFNVNAKVGLVPAGNYRFKDGVTHAVSPTSLPTPVTEMTFQSNGQQFYGFTWAMPGTMYYVYDIANLSAATGATPACTMSPMQSIWMTDTYRVVTVLETQVVDVEFAEWFKNATTIV